MADGPTYPIETIAKLLDLTGRQVQSLAAQGILPKAERGQYEIVPVVQAYIRYLRDRSPSGDSKNAEFQASRTRLLTARARRAESEIELLGGSLLQREAVEVAWGSIILNMRAQLLALPSSYAPALHRAKTMVDVAAILRDAINDTLAEIATAPVYAAPVPGRLAGAAGDGSGGAEPGGTAANADPVAMG
jgi:phage terminase Nu1 subunit (DNA packaging protein)